jgi:predicted nucleic acid-binding protein
MRSSRAVVASRNASFTVSLIVEVPKSARAKHVQRALQVQRLLAQASQRGRKIPDLLVAAAAEGLGLEVLHYDGDFDLIASVTGQRCSWVVPVGSVE